MYARIPCLLLSLALAGILPLGLGQVRPQMRPQPKRADDVRRPPFLLEAKSYEESPFTTRVVFKNGMTVLVNEFRAHSLVSIQAFVDGGTARESEQNAGIASLVSSIIGRGPVPGSSGTLRQKVQALGGRLRSRIDYAHAQYEIVAPAMQWKQALAAQAESLLQPSFDAAAVRLEASLARMEAWEMLETPSVAAKELLLDLGFAQPRLAKYSALAKISPDAIAPETVARFHKTHFIPAAITLVISGDVRAGEVLNEVARLYPSSPSRTGVLDAVHLKGEPMGFRYRALRGESALARVLFGFHAVSEKSDDYRALEVLGAMLGLGEGAILPTRLRDQKEWMLETETDLRSYADSGLFTIEMVIEPQHLDRSEIALFTEIELLQREPPTPAEMERALAQLEQRYWKQLETVSGRAATLAAFELAGDWKRMDRYVAELRAVKPADVQRAAARYLRLDNCSLVEYLPPAMKERILTAEAVRNTLEGLLKPAADQEQQERTREVVLSYKIPAAAGAFKFAEIQHPFQMASILRGPDLFIREEHVAPLIDMGIFFPGGKSEESDANSGITSLMLQWMLRGGKDMHGARLQRQLDLYGATLRPVVAGDFFGFQCTILSRNFEAGFDLLQEAVRAPLLDREEIERLKRRQILHQRNRGSATGSWKQWVMGQLFKDHAYARDGSGTEQSLAAITPEALQSWHGSHVHNIKPLVVIIGDFKGTSPAAQFVQKFSGSRMLEGKMAESYAKPMAGGIALERRRNSRNSLVLMGFQAPPVADEDGYAASVLQNYLGDYGRFAQALRDAEGIAPRLSFAYTPELRGGSLLTCALTRPQDEEAVVNRMRAEIRQLIEAPIPYRELRAAIHAAAGSYAIDNQARGSQIMHLARLILAGKSLEDYQGFAAGLREVQAEELKDLAQRLLKPEAAVVLRVHGEP